jgi:hypothetical protein
MRDLALPVAFTVVGVLGILNMRAANGSNINFFPGVENRFRDPLILGILSLLLTRTSAVTETPRRLTALMQTVPVRIFFVFTLSFLANPDIENAVFLSFLFLGLIQLLRTKDERERHPYIL